MKSLLAVAFISAFASAQECSHLWNRNLEIDPVEPKRFLGDSFAGYGLLSYRNVRNLKWVFKAKFPKSRFMSIETYTTTNKKRYDVQFDHQFIADPGSFNPYQEGVPMEVTARDFTVTLLPREGKSTTANVVHISPNASVHAIYYRMFAPSGEKLTNADLPLIYAYNDKTGEEMACPRAADAEFHPNYPQQLLLFVTAEENFGFKDKVVDNGQNSAIPWYVYGMNRVKHWDVTVVRFKSPTFSDNQSAVGPFQRPGEVAYWSLCTQNFVQGQTLKCIPDYRAKVSADGWVTIVIGIGEEVRKVAEARGYTFLEDRRKSNQGVVQIVYRNLLPKEDFAKTHMYQGEYRPQGRSCPAKKFLEQDC